MAFTQANLDAIDAAIASGELTVSVAGRTITYRSIDDLIKARAVVSTAVAAAAASTARAGPRHQLADFTDD
jgi:ribosomal protein L12E/L44/L45/RPP1/RPP2